MPTKSDKADELLQAMGDQANLDALYDIWTLLRQCPSRAVEIMMQFKDVSRSARDAVTEINATVAQYNAIRPKITEIASAAKEMQAWQASVRAIDENTILNRLSRITEAAAKVDALRKSGTLELIERLLKDSKG
jgi:hypothetical protein